ncbi:MAG: transcription initiation factor TFIIB [Natrialbaceae archaeon]|jgi:transcription initiation factor TFIIB
MSHSNRSSQTRERPAPERTDAENESTADPSVRTGCPDCDGDVIDDERRGERVCEDCGIVIAEDQVDRGPEWRSFNSQESRERSRVGAPVTETLHDRGLSSMVGKDYTDAKGQPLSSKTRKKMSRLRTWDERFRTRNASERNLKQAFGEIDRMASALGLPKNVRETASVIYRRAVEEDLLPGRSIEAMATAALYAAARQGGTPRTLDEFEPVSRVDRQEFARGYRYLARELGLAVEPADPASYLPRFASDLDLPENAERRARELLETGKARAVHSGKSPAGVAAAAIYAGSVLANEKVTQARVAEVANVSEVTIRNRYQELLAADKAAGTA